MKRILIATALLTLSLLICAQPTTQVEYFDLQDVRLLDSPFKHAQDLNKKYLLELNPDRLLAPFLREAGFALKAESYTNWENSGLDGHIGGHYLSALSLMYASTGDMEIKQRLDYMLSELHRCQEANGNGYIGGVPEGKAIWEEIADGNIRAGSFNLNDRWVPLYNIHKTYAGLRDAWLYAQSEPAREMLVKMSDWAISLVSQLTEEQIQDMLRSEYGGLNETFADVAVITGDEKYLKLARQFSQQLILDPLLRHEDQLTGMHANTQIPKVLGFKRIADIEGNTEWSEASRYFWETVVKHRSLCIGGNSVGEHFNPTNDFSRVIQSIEGPETCNTYNMLRLTRMLYQTSKDKSYIDYYERALYNHILSSQNPTTGGLVYFTQMRPGHYRVYSQPQTSMWCCVGSGIENHSKYGEMIYAHTDNELFVNLFIPSQLTWGKKKVVIVQENNFPDKPETELTINPEKTTEFTLQLRYPAWVSKGELRISINGKEYPVSENSAGYVSIHRKWKKGDKIVMKMPMKISTEQLPDHSNYYSIMYGPLVLAAKTETDNMDGLFADDSRGGHVAHGRQVPMKDMPVIVSEPSEITSLVNPVEDKSLTFTLTSLYSEKYPSTLELIPFYRLHESRYIIYWPQATSEGLKKMQEKIEQEEREQIILDSKTIDKVVCGEQQPESDHFIQSQDSWTGFIEDIHWREANGWFSYRMKNTHRGGKYLYLKYFDIDQARAFDISIENQIVGSARFEGNHGNNMQVQILEIPEDIDNEFLEIKISGNSNLMTPKIVEVRILSSE
ncbi:glycoside hydrolase family 127 protein [Dysgonomonas sp. 25]|uniref:glycoside hydrolase family 127 protein n=1 Tax=Dysgonomonas sp. 25 TaxID=2302933 RepID=UPI0013D655B0|nr:glycoside hydrolase family 127 protein [Dysgonomonas sp. 25]NDV68549.1 glycosyl hydrolase [Dysgonomonas sp. 25]